MDDAVGATVDHPALQDLIRFSNGLPVENEVGISSHLLDCVECCNRLSDDTSNDSFQELIREVLSDATATLVTGTQSDLWRPQELSPKPKTDESERRLGDFRIVRELGHGGMGQVYEAIQESIQRPVALKVLTSVAWRRGRNLERFQREARAVGKLHHSHIVDVFGSGQENDVCYFAMQLIKGQGLDRVISDCSQHQSDPGSGETHSTEKIQCGADTHPAMPMGLDVEISPNPGTPETVSTERSSRKSNARARAELAARIGCEIAEALQYAHENGVLHRDVKPSNILIDQQGTAWLTDFGLAKLQSDETDLTLTEQGDLVGTLRYMAPESLSGVADARSDVFGLGLTLLELVTLTPSFKGSSKNDLLQQRLQGVAPSVRVIEKSVPADLMTVLRKAVQSEPAARYQTAGEFADDLKRVRNNEPIRARRVTILEQLSLWTRRNRLIATLLLMTFTLMSAGLTAALLAAQHFRSLEGEQRELVIEKTDLANEKGELADRNADLAEQNSRFAKEAQDERDRSALLVSDVLAKQGLDAAADGRAHEALVLLAGAADKSHGLDSHRYRANVLRFQRLMQEMARPIAARHIQHVVVMDATFHPDAQTVLLDLLAPATDVLIDVESSLPINLPEAIGVAESLAWSSDGRHLYVGGNGRVTQLRFPELDQPKLIASISESDPESEESAKLADGEQLSHKPDAVVSDIKRDDSGRLLALVSGSSVHLWDVELKDFRGTPMPHESEIVDLCFSPDSKWLVTVDSSGKFHVFDTTVFTARQGIPTPRISGTHLRAGIASFTCPVFLNDRKTLITKRNDHTLEYWNLPTGQTIGRFETPAHGIRCAEPLKGSKYFLGGTEGGSIVRCLAGGQSEVIPWPGIGREAQCAAYNPVNDHLVVGYGSRPTEVWSVADQTRLAATMSGPLFCGAVAYSENYRRLAVVSGSRTRTLQEIRVWEMPNKDTGDLSIRLGDHTHSAAFSPDSRYIAVLETSGALQVWDLQMRQCMAVLKLPARVGFNHFWLTFLPDGQRLAVCSFQEGMGQRVLDIFNWQSQEHLQTFTSRSELEIYDKHTSQSLTPNATRLLIRTGLERAALFDLTERVLTPTIFSREGVQDWTRLSPDGAWSVGRLPPSGDQHRLVLVKNNEESTDRTDAAGTRDPTATTTPRSVQHHTAIIERVNFSHDQRFMATNSWDATTSIWDADLLLASPSASPRLLQSLSHSAPVYSSQFSPDNRHVLTISKGGSAQVWDLETGRIVGSPITSIEDIGATFRPGSDELITVDFEGHFDVWDWQESTKLWPTTRLFRTPGTIWAGGRSLVLSSDGLRAAVGGQGAIRIVDLAPLDDPRLPVPRTLMATAEVVSGMRLNDKGTPTQMASERWRSTLQLRQSSGDSLVSHQLIANNRPVSPALDETQPPKPPSSSESVSAREIAAAYASKLDRESEPSVQHELINELRITDAVLGELVEIRPENAQLHLAKADRIAEREDDATAMSHRRTALPLLQHRLQTHPDDSFVATQVAELLLKTNTTVWHDLEFKKATSKLGTTLKVQEDGSVLASGENPPSDLYSLEMTTDLKDIAGLRLEVLPHSSLPNHGPGRHSSGNFQLAAFRVFATDENDPSVRTPIPIRDVTATYTWSDPIINVRGTIDENDPRVWHVWDRFGESHSAIFSLRHRISVPPGKPILVELQNYTPEKDPLNLGRFRLSVSSDDPSEIQRLQEAIRNKRISGFEALAAVYRALRNTAKAESFDPGAKSNSK